MSAMKTPITDSCENTDGSIKGNDELIETCRRFETELQAANEEIATLKATCADYKSQICTPDNCRKNDEIAKRDAVIEVLCNSHDNTVQCPPDMSCPGHKVGCNKCRREWVKKELAKQ